MQLKPFWLMVLITVLLELLGYHFPVGIIVPVRNQSTVLANGITVAKPLQPVVVLH